MGTLAAPDLSMRIDQAIQEAHDHQVCEILGFDPIERMIWGFEKGYNEEAGLIRETTDGADMRAMWREFQASVNMLNKGRDPLISLFTFKVTRETEKVLQPTAEDFEEASEFGEPKGVRLGVPFVMGYPFKWYDLAIRYTWKYLLDVTSDELRALNNTALEGSRRLVFAQAMKTLFNSSNTTADLNNGTAVNVYKFYNADGTVPPPYKNITHSGSHTHYLASGAATVDPGDLQELEDHLQHHGYRINDGFRLLLLANKAQTATIRTFKAGTASALYDFIPLQGIGGGVYLPANSGIVGRPSIDVPQGLNAIGTYGPFIIIEEDYVPAGYIAALASGGDQNIGNPIGIREHPNRKGLVLVQGPDRDYPLTDSFYQQGLGMGVRERGAGVLMQITTNASYAIPAAYA